MKDCHFGVLPVNYSESDQKENLDLVIYRQTFLLNVFSALKGTHFYILHVFGDIQADILLPLYETTSIAVTAMKLTMKFNTFLLK